MLAKHEMEIEGKEEGNPMAAAVSKLPPKLRPNNAAWFSPTFLLLCLVRRHRTPSPFAPRGDVGASHGARHCPAAWTLAATIRTPPLVSLGSHPRHALRSA